MKMKTVAVVGLVFVVAITIAALISGKPNQTPKQFPEATPQASRNQSVDPKSVGGTQDPSRQ